MAIKSLYEFADGLYPEAYFMVRKITLGNSDEEYFDTDSAGFDTLMFKKVHQSTAFIFVYGNYDARERSARPINAFGVEFEYKGGNVYQEAYEALKNTETIQSGVWEDV